MEFSHPISPRTPEKYDSTFGTKITLCLKKIGGMMLWIMSSTFKYIISYQVYFHHNHIHKINSFDNSNNLHSINIKNIMTIEHPYDGGDASEGKKPEDDAPPLPKK